MSDIVERLRRVGDRVQVPCPDKLEGCLVLHSKIETYPACLDAINEIERLRSRSETLEAALRAMESAFVLLTKTMQGSEIAIPLDAARIIINAREVARAAMSKENDAI
jgi:hypothetical protein